MSIMAPLLGPPLQLFVQTSARDHSPKRRPLLSRATSVVGTSILALRHPFGLTHVCQYGLLWGKGTTYTSRLARRLYEPSMNERVATLLFYVFYVFGVISKCFQFDLKLVEYSE